MLQQRLPSSFSLRTRGEFLALPFKGTCSTQSGPSQGPCRSAGRASVHPPLTLLLFAKQGGFPSSSVPCRKEVPGICPRDSLQTCRTRRSRKAVAVQKAQAREDRPSPALHGRALPHQHCCLHAQPLPCVAIDTTGSREHWHQADNTGATAGKLVSGQREHSFLQQSYRASNCSHQQSSTGSLSCRIQGASQREQFQLERDGT